MRKIIISINPEHVKNIIDGSKKYEYRTKVAMQDIESILVYCTYPYKKIVAEVAINSILEDTPKNLWERTKKFSGINKDFYDKYFEGRELAYAYELGSVTRFDIPKDLSEYGIMTAPQSYVYLKI